LLSGPDPMPVQNAVIHCSAARVSQPVPVILSFAALRQIALRHEVEKFCGLHRVSPAMVVLGPKVSLSAGSRHVYIESQQSRWRKTMSLNSVTLDDKYDLGQNRVFVTGYQALVRLTLLQKERDRRAGLNTAGYVTGYRGSPLGGLDYQFQRAESRLKN